MDPKRLTALKALTTLLEGVTPGNGFQVDLSSSVHRGKSLFGDNDGDLVVGLLQTPPDDFPITPEENQTAEGKWTIYVHGFAKSANPTHPIDEAEVAMADVKKQLALLKPRMIQGQAVQVYDSLGGTISGGDVDFGATFVDSEKAQTVGQFLLRLELDFIEDTGDPYAV